jgi:multiple sugar transport system substrate-binding protein
MSIRKRMLSVALVLVTVFSLLGGTAFSKERPKLTVWTEKSFAPLADKTIVDNVNKFARENNIEVEVITISWSEFVRKLIAAIEARATPDVAMIDNGATMQYASNGLLVEMSDIYRKVVKEQGEPFSVASMDATYKDKQYSIPMSIMTHGLLYRKDLLDAKGLAIPKTWDEVLSASKAIANPPYVYGYAFPLSKTKDAENFLTQIFWAFGSKMVSKDGKTITFDSPETVAAVKYIVELYKYMPQGVTGWDDSGDNRAFQSEQLAFATNSGTIAMWCEENKPDLFQRMGITYTPAGPAGRQNIASMRSMGVFKNSKNVKLAKQLVTYLMTKANYQKWLEGYGGYYSPAYLGTSKHPYWQDSIRKTYMENAKAGHGIGWPGPLTIPAREVYSSFVLTDMVQSVLIQDKSPEQMVKETAQKIKSIYARYK